MSIRYLTASLFSAIVLFWRWYKKELNELDNKITSRPSIIRIFYTK